MSMKAVRVIFPEAVTIGYLNHEKKIALLQLDNTSQKDDIEYLVIFPRYSSKEVTKSSSNEQKWKISVIRVRIFYNARTIAALEQEKEHWRLGYQLLKVKFEKMRDGHSKQIEELKEKTVITTNEQIDGLISTSPPISTVNLHEILEQVLIHEVNVKAS
ncbi:hypothetical protein I4U23_030951 [Adineta vaga]|nr:hypothetical protein I4U23_030951 [Adineta vaga]